MITRDRRAFKRVRRKFTVRYKRHGSDDPHGGAAVSENISLGGVYFTSFEKFEIGQLIDCSITMPKVKDEGKWIARVVRCEDADDRAVKTYGVAVEFVKAFGSSEKDLKKILSNSR